MEKGYCVFNYDEVKNADFIDFLAYLMKELRQDYQRDKKGLNSFFLIWKNTLRIILIKK
ncbi:hypothetical protein B6794_008880 [Campylobacter jejuni]